MCVCVCVCVCVSKLNSSSSGREGELICAVACSGRFRENCFIQKCKMSGDLFEHDVLEAITRWRQGPVSLPVHDVRDGFSISQTTCCIDESRIDVLPHHLQPSNTSRCIHDRCG